MKAPTTTFTVERYLLPVHWFEDKEGNGLTNFRPEQLQIYEQAVLEYTAMTGDDSFVISLEPIEARYTPEGYYSLHHLVREDSGKFWEVFYRIKSTFAKE